MKVMKVMKVVMEKDSKVLIFLNVFTPFGPATVYWKP